MDTRIVREFGMKRASHDLSLAHQQRIAAFADQHFHARSGADDLRRPNEHHLQRLLAQSRLLRSDGAVNLPSIGVAPYADIERAQRNLRRIFNVLRQQDGSRAGSERRPRADEVAQLLEKAALFKKVQEGARFASGDDDRVDRIKLLGFAYQENVSAQPFQHGLVCDVVTLDCETSDGHGQSKTSAEDFRRSTQKRELKNSKAKICESEEHTSELQSPDHLVCRLLLEKKKKKNMSAS